MRIVLIAVLFIINNAFAQGETENLMESESVQETLNSVEEVFQEPYPSERLEEKWSDRLSGKGKTLGVLNSDGSLYIITSASVVRASDDPGFIDRIVVNEGKGKKPEAYFIKNLDLNVKNLNLTQKLILIFKIS